MSDNGTCESCRHFAAFSSTDIHGACNWIMPANLAVALGFTNQYDPKIPTAKVHVAWCCDSHVEGT